MSGTKVVVIVLVLIALIFIVVAVWGAGKNGPVPKPPHDPKKDADTFNDPNSNPRMKSFAGLFSSFGPKLDPKQIQPPRTTFDLRAQAHYEVKVLADSNKQRQFRQAKFKVRSQPPPDCARVVYEASPEAGRDPKNKDLMKQESKDSKDRSEFMMAVLPEGGTITVDRVSPTSTGLCTVQLE